MRKIYYKETKQDLKNEVEMKCWMIFCAGFIVSSSIEGAIKGFAEGNVIDGVMNLGIMIMWTALFIISIKFLKTIIDSKLNFLGDMHNLENELLEDRINELENTSDSEEQEDGDTKEHECELEESSKMS